MNTKVCSKCNVEKEICEFHKHKPSKDGVRGVCKECRKLEKNNNFEYRIKNKDKIKIKNKIWLEKNPNYMIQYNKEYNLKNRVKINEKLKKWRETNKEYYLNKTNTQKKERYHNDIEFKLKHLLRSRINKIINFKRDKPSLEILGCSLTTLINHIESKFEEGMSWDNYSYYGWHIDHIIPISSAKTEDEIYKLCHYTNLQPLWAKDNIIKSNKIIKT